MKLKTLLLSAAACAAVINSASAADAPKKHHHHVDSVESRLNHMEQLIEAQQAEIRDLKSQVSAKNGGTGNTAVAEVAPAPEPEVTGAQFEALQNQVYEQAAATRSSATVTMKKGRPTIASSDGKNTLAIRADVMADYAAYSKSAVTTAAFPGPSPNLQPLRNGFNFRRAQLGIEGKLAGDFGYKLQYEFGGAGGQETGNGSSTSAGVGARVKEGWVSYRGILDPFTFKVGVAPWPTNLNDAMASDDLLFDERPSPAQISRSLAGDDGRFGAGFIGNGDIWNASVFLTGDTFGKGAIDGQSAVVGRAAIAPIQNADSNFNIHLGGNISYVFKPEDTGTGLPPSQSLSFSDRPELRVTDVKLINTGGIPADTGYSAGLEAGVSYQAFLLQGEYFWYGVDRSSPLAQTLSNPHFNGWYVEGSYVLTGEPRPYSIAAAAFGRPSPSASFDPATGNWGAWELAARYSQSDLNFDLTSLTSGEAVNGGLQDIWSVGMNFYPNDNLKFMFDYQNVHVKKSGLPTTYSDFVLRSQFAL